MSKTPRIGITGGIGSGKTLVSGMFATLGIPVYDADAGARRLIVEDGTVRQAIIGLLGPDAYFPDGSYNREWVAGIVFKDAEKLAALNHIVHPAVERDSMAWHLREAEKGVPYTLKEAALMIESGGYRFLDRLILVTAPEAMRIQRVMARDTQSAEQVQARIRAQLSEADKRKYADFVLENDGKKALIPQVWAVHQAILKEF
jgi:dephospho-CoA kinase